MEISLLNVKVTFQKNSVVADDIGNRRNVWEDYYTCHATVSGEGGNEKAAAGLTVVDSDIAFTIRFCKRAAEVWQTPLWRLWRNMRIWLQIM